MVSDANIYIAALKLKLHKLHSEQQPSNVHLRILGKMDHGPISSPGWQIHYSDLVQDTSASRLRGWQFGSMHLKHIYLYAGNLRPNSTNMLWQTWAWAWMPGTLCQLTKADNRNDWRKGEYHCQRKCAVPAFSTKRWLQSTWPLANCLKAYARSSFHVNMTQHVHNTACL